MVIFLFYVNIGVAGDVDDVRLCLISYQKVTDSTPILWQVAKTNMVV